MSQVKYVIVEVMGLETAIVFSDLIEHSDIGQGMNVVAAGFCNIFNDGNRDELDVDCFGRSASLKIKSRGYDDELIVKRHLNLT
jgi:hypothetical protein